MLHRTNYTTWDWHLIGTVAYPRNWIPKMRIWSRREPPWTNLCPLFSPFWSSRSVIGCSLSTCPDSEHSPPSIPFVVIIYRFMDELRKPVFVNWNVWKELNNCIYPTAYQRFELLWRLQGQRFLGTIQAKGMRMVINPRMRIKCL